MADDLNIVNLKLAKEDNPTPKIHIENPSPKNSIVVKTTAKNPNKLFLFLKKHSDVGHPPSYDEAVTEAKKCQGIEGGEELSPGKYTVRIYENPTDKIKKDSDEEEEDKRETWGNNFEFLLSIIGFAVDLANVWRFPYLCYKNGGGAFLIPYTLMLVLGALPLFYMELILGQFHRQGPISVWKICPLFKGVGYCSVLVAFFVSFYYNVIIGWAVHFMISSFRAKLPWQDCSNEWNTPQCITDYSSCLVGDRNVSNEDDLSSITNGSSAFNTGSMFANATFENGLTNEDNSSFTNSSTLNVTIYCNEGRSPAKEYFNRQVLKLQKSDGIDDLGAPQLDIILCIGAVYILLYLSLFKGVKSSGKVVWLTATMPYVVLTILLIRGLTLEGALEGISFYLNVDWARLAKSEVWVDAAIQVFYSVGAGFGTHLAYSSYNKFHNNCYKDCLITSAVNSFTSFFSGFVIFTYLGYMAHTQKKKISEVADEGPGLVFEVYPQAVATLPGSQFWAVIFFFMLIMLGMDSAMGGLECVITGLMDEFKEFFHKHRISREIFTGIVVSFSFLVAMSCVTPGGFYIFTLLDTYAAGLSLLATVFFEAIAISWFYGLKNFSNDVEAMLGHRPGLYWRICWKFMSPLFLASIIGVQMVEFGPLTLDRYDGVKYLYPGWAQWIGRLLAASTVTCIPVGACIAIYNAAQYQRRQRTNHLIVRSESNSGGSCARCSSWMECLVCLLCPCGYCCYRSCGFLLRTKILAIAMTPMDERRDDQDEYVRQSWAHWRQL